MVGRELQDKEGFSEKMRGPRGEVRKANGREGGGEGRQWVTVAGGEVVSVSWEGQLSSWGSADAWLRNTSCPFSGPLSLRTRLEYAPCPAGPWPCSFHPVCARGAWTHMHANSHTYAHRHTHPYTPSHPHWHRLLHTDTAGQVPLKCQAMPLPPRRALCDPANQRRPQVLRAALAAGHLLSMATSLIPVCEFKSSGARRVSPIISCRSTVHCSVYPL